MMYRLVLKTMAGRSPKAQILGGKVAFVTNTSVAVARVTGWPLQIERF